MDRGIGPSTDPCNRLPLRSAVLIMLYSISLLMVHFGRPWSLTFHEVNYAEPAREFIQTGDWLVPRILGQPIWDKPPLMHWAIAGSMLLFQTEAEWAARFPSAFAAALTALFVAGLAARWSGARVGLLAGLIQSTAVYVMIQARLAEADMLLCACVTAALACFGRGVVGREAGERVPKIWIVGYFAAAGLSFLAKGPIGPALVAVGSGLYAIFSRRWAPWRLLLDPIGWGIMVGLIIAWPAAAMLQEPGLLESWWRHNADRFSGTMDGERKDPFFYVYTMLWMALPWSPLALVGLISSRRMGQAPRSARWFLLCCIVGGLGLLSMSAWKHKHYIIPILPPLSIAAAIVLERLLVIASTKSRRHLWTWINNMFSIVMFLAGLGGIFYAERSQVLLLTTGLIAIVGAVGSAITHWGRSQERVSMAIGSLFATIWVSFVIIQSIAMPAFDIYRPQSELAERVSQEIPAEMKLRTLSIPDPQITYYFRLPAELIDWPKLAELINDPDQTMPLVIICPQFVAERLKMIGTVQIIDRATAHHPRKTEADRVVAAEFYPLQHSIALDNKDKNSSIQQ